MKFVCSLLASASLAAVLVVPVPAEAALSPAARAKTQSACRPADSGFFRDQGLTMGLASKLKFNKKLLSEQIDVRVSSGVATLSGGMSTQEHIVAALNIAAEMEGIACIHNFLRVGPPDPRPPSQS